LRLPSCSGGLHQGPQPADGTKHIRGIGQRTVCLRYANGQALRPNVPETPPCPPPASHSERIDMGRCTGRRRRVESRPPPRLVDARSSASSSSTTARREGRLQESPAHARSVVPYSGGRATGQSKPARSGTRTHRSITGSQSQELLPCRSFLQRVRPWRASGSASSSTARSGVVSGSRRTAGRQPHPPAQGSVIDASHHDLPGRGTEKRNPYPSRHCPRNFCRSKAWPRRSMW